MTLSRSVYQRKRINTSEILQSDLNIEQKTRSNPLAWNGQFSPQLIELLLKKYATQNSRVFDPFLGSGTVLLEAGRQKISAVGTEINPAGVALSRLYELINIAPATHRAYMDSIDMLLGKVYGDLLFRNRSDEKDEGRQQILGMFEEIETLAEQRLLEALITLLDFSKTDFSPARVLSIWAKVKNIVSNLPFSEQPIQVFHADARSLPLDDSSVDLVITSPPYINVFNYHQQYRASMEALGWDLLAISHSEMGANRKHRSNRFLTVIQYHLDIAKCFIELLRVSHSKSRFIFIVGRESMVRGVSFNNGEIVCNVACKIMGCRLDLRQERVFTNRFGQRIVEDILHFLPPTERVDKPYLAESRSLGYSTLQMALHRADLDKADDIRVAMKSVMKIQPSPLFTLAKSHKNLEPVKDENDGVINASR